VSAKSINCERGLRQEYRPGDTIIKGSKYLPKMLKTSLSSSFGRGAGGWEHLKFFFHQKNLVDDVYVKLKRQCENLLKMRFDSSGSLPMICTLVQPVNGGEERRRQNSPAEFPPYR
jgi:hypothetical protein